MPVSVTRAPPLQAEQSVNATPRKVPPGLAEQSTVWFSCRGPKHAWLPPCSVVTPWLVKAGEGLMHGRVGEGRRGRERERSRSWRPPSSPQAAVAQALPHGPLRQGVCSRCARYNVMEVFDWCVTACPRHADISGALVPASVRPLGRLLAAVSEGPLPVAKRCNCR